MPLPSLADQVRGRDPDVVEDRLARGRALDAELVLELADGEAGAVGLDHEGADARASGRARVGLGEDDVEVGDPEVGDPVLGAGDDPLVAVLDRLGDHAAGVGARLGLGQRERRRPLARRAPGQEALLELVGAEQLDRQRAEVLEHQDQRGGGARARDLLDRDAEHQRAGAGPAVLPPRTAGRAGPARRTACGGPTGTPPWRRSRPRAARPARARSGGWCRGSRPDRGSGHTRQRRLSASPRA